MRKKTIRKNANKERIFSQRQNIQDFDYVKDHRGKVDGKNPELPEKETCIPGLDCRCRVKSGKP